MAFELGRADVPEFSADAASALEGYAWPGNVRELKNVVERAVYRSESALIRDIVFDPFQSPLASTSLTAQEPPAHTAPAGEAEAARPFAEAVREFEVRLIRRALRKARHNQKRAAESLGLTYHQFRGLYRKHRDLIDSEPGRSG